MTFPLSLCCFSVNKKIGERKSPNPGYNNSAQLESFLNKLAQAKDTIVKSGLKDALILHHDEADGLCSAALAKIAIENLGIETRLICLDKLYPEVVKDVEGVARRLVVFSDLGSGMTHPKAEIRWSTTSTLNSTDSPGKGTRPRQQSHTCSPRP